MWILPKNYPLSSHFAQGMVESKEDLTSQELDIESSLMWRSKPSPLQTWLRRWKQDSWIQHLYTRILKPSQRTSFETALTSSLAATPASHSVQQESEKEQMTPDTCGLTSGDTLNQLDLFSASLRMSRDTSRLDSPQLSATWKKMVTQQRGEYSQRVKLAHSTNESESTSWPTATVFDVTGGNYPTQIVNGKWRSKHSTDPNSPWYGAKLRDAVETAEKMYPTPSARDYKGGYTEKSIVRKDGKSRRFDLLPNAAIGGVGTDVVPGHLNPEWVEWLMGVPTGWTELDSWVTQLSHKPQQEHTKL